MKKAILSILLASTIFLGIGQDRIKMHKVAKGETLYSIAREYGISVSDIARANPDLKKSDFHVRIGDELAIPNQMEAVANKVKVKPVASTPETPYTEEDNMLHPRQGDALANTNNDVPVERIKPAASAPISLRTSSSNAAEYPVLFSQYFMHGYKGKKNRGAANYLGDNISGNQYLAFYNDAENGSVIKVTNLMNKKVVFVKVVGKVPPVDASQEVILKLSHKAAHELGAIDEKFLVEVVGCNNNN